MIYKKTKSVACLSIFAYNCKSKSKYLIVLSKSLIENPDSPPNESRSSYSALDETNNFEINHLALPTGIINKINFQEGFLMIITNQERIFIENSKPWLAEAQLVMCHCGLANLSHKQNKKVP